MSEKDDAVEIPELEGAIVMTKEQHEAMINYASEFNLTIQGAFLELMEKMDSIHIDHPHAHIVKGNFAPLALGAAIAAIVERYDPSCEREFWELVMSKYGEARQALDGVLEMSPEEEDERGVTTVEMQPNAFDISKMKH